MTKGQNLILIPRNTIEFLTTHGFMRHQYLKWYDLYAAYINLDKHIPAMQQYDILAAQFDTSQDRIRHIINILNRYL